MNSRSDVILPHKKFTWADFGDINTDIHPRRYAPGYAAAGTTPTVAAPNMVVFGKQAPSGE